MRRPSLPRSTYRWAWRAWVGWFLAWEALAILDPDRGETFTANSRPLVRRHPVATLMAAAFLEWLRNHYLEEPWGEAG